MSRFALVLLLSALGLAGLLLMYVWPFGRPAVLIPLIMWMMVAVNRWHVSGPMLGLIDHAARSREFVPVFPAAAGAADDRAAGAAR